MLPQIVGKSMVLDSHTLFIEEYGHLYDESSLDKLQSAIKELEGMSDCPKNVIFTESICFKIISIFEIISPTS